ncbi:MAG TPA: FtsW/RodA/SpoVE family cell cycle protein [Bacteroidales bacterium]|nr:FtsW/RodA/SpoVE family cell cycle protein [Bacteroidales bacterium]
MKTPKLTFRGDRGIWILVLFLTIFSLLAVYSSTRTLAFSQQGSGGFYLLKHLGIVLFGLFLMYVSHLINYPFYARFARILLLAAILLLLYTLLRGASVNEARRWVIIPIINLTFQTSDFAKLALTIFLARSLTLKQEEIQEGNLNVFIKQLAPILVVCGLILPSNFSTAAILFVSSMVLLFIGRARIKHILVLGIAGVAFLAVFIAVMSMMPEDRQGRVGTWSERIKNFGGDGEQEEVYQAKQAKIAIASGGILGRMPGNSIQRNYLPNPFSDFIYAIIIEEYGLAGGVILILLYLALLFRSIRAALGSPGTFGTLLAVGLGFNLVFQAMINMAVASGLMPVTGQPLPLVSMGGTSIWFTSISIGIILSVSRSANQEEEDSITENSTYETATSK